MSDRRRDPTDDVEPVGGTPAPTEYGNVEPFGSGPDTIPVLPIGRDGHDVETVR